MRLIDADELLKNEFKNDISFNAFQNLVKRQKTIDAVPVVHGEWVEDEYGFIHCSECRMEWDEPEHPQTNYCPNCGAKMDGKEKDDALDS